MSSELEIIRRKGIILETAVLAHTLIGLIIKLKPIKTQFELMRIGSEQDGGYLIPDDIDDIAACFSPGIKTKLTFGKDLFDSFGINFHLADYSIIEPPENVQPLSFTKKFLGPVNNKECITLDSWVKGTTEYDSAKDLLLQMDIEGEEYSTILATSEEILHRFRIIVIKVHNIDKWGHPSFFKIATSFFDKLLQQFNVVHAHFNNHGTIVNVGGVELPEIIEFTFLSKSRSESLGKVTSLPDELDRICDPKQPDRGLPDIWWK